MKRVKIKRAKPVRRQPPPIEDFLPIRRTVEPHRLTIVPNNNGFTFYCSCDWYEAYVCTPSSPNYTNQLISAYGMWYEHLAHWRSQSTYYVPVESEL